MRSSRFRVAKRRKRGCRHCCDLVGGSRVQTQRGYSGCLRDDGCRRERASIDTNSSHRQPRAVRNQLREQAHHYVNLRCRRRRQSDIRRRKRTRVRESELLERGEFRVYLTYADHRPI